MADRVTWQDVRDTIHERVLSGELQPGDRLPRDADIAAELDCARSTVGRAMQDLADAGLLERRRKGGTRVRAEPVTRATFEIPITRAEIEARGGRYSHQLIRQGKADPPPAALAAIERPAPHPMMRIEALHLSDGRPYMLEDRWISLETVPEFVSVDLNAQSANEWLVLNRPYDRCDLKFYAVSASATEAELLGTAPGAALLVTERTTWIDGAPITTVRALAGPGYQVLSRG